ncbi:phage late control D family protein [Roseibium alexandrii]|uniref:Tail protein n=1 Tax=Roseibium alexandrii TaxID=388408 RepID=A0A0M7AQ55_9HYPH|nr:contractile injection system protein, VgrG/Pvc8 family [Roseibium alexandrii]CTQ75923.1 tail protein [Roseibium alexandrii]
MAHWKTHWKVLVNGQDMTISMRPFLIDITVTDKEGSASDTCALTLDDTGGQLALPSEGASLLVFLNGVLVFSGVVDTVRSSGSRGGGRLLRVSAKGFDSRGKIKQPMQIHQDDGTIGDFLKKLGNKVGLDVKVDPGFASIARTYLAADGESFLHVGQRLARELGATFKIRNTQAVFAKRGVDAGLPAVTGRAGAKQPGNVINWDIAPFAGRRSFTKAKVQYFDREAAEFKTEEVDIDLDRGLPEAVNFVRSKAADKSQAKDIAEARKREAEREGGEGSVLLDLTPEAQAEAMFALKGARPGVDGTYRIVTVTHKADRNGGSTTALELKQPGGGAGKDSRKSKNAPDTPIGAQGTSGAGGADGAAGGGSGLNLDNVGSGLGDGPE